MHSDIRNNESTSLRDDPRNSDSATLRNKDLNSGSTAMHNEARIIDEHNLVNDTNQKGMLTGMFRDRKSAENAYDTLHERGYSEKEINLVMSKDTHKKYFSTNEEETELGNKAAAGSGAGSAIGGTVGAIAGIVAAIGTSIVIPGLGLVIAGPLAAGLAGAGAGGIAGGLIGALVGWGIPKDRAKLYESGIEDGHIVLGVKPKNEDDARYLEDNWRQNDAQEIHR
jgi:hypothetical protein